MSDSYIGSAMSLRWIERDVPGKFAYGERWTRTERVLQYGLRPVNGREVVWFDVPLAAPSNVAGPGPVEQRAQQDEKESKP